MGREDSQTGRVAGAEDATAGFDYRGLWAAIESERLARGLTKTALLRDIHWLSQGVLDRIEQGGETTCQHITGLLRWLNRTPESFTPGAVDGPDCALPDVGPFALRWSLPALWEAVDARRQALGLSWPQVSEELHWSGVRRFAVDLKYGIPMSLAMRVAGWVGRPAAAFMYAAEPAPKGIHSATWGTARAGSTGEERR